MLLVAIRTRVLRVVVNGQMFKNVQFIIFTRLIWMRMKNSIYRSQKQSSSDS